MRTFNLIHELLWLGDDDDDDEDEAALEIKDNKNLRGSLNLVKKELSQQVKLSIYRPIYVPTLT